MQIEQDQIRIEVPRFGHTVLDFNLFFLGEKNEFAKSTLYLNNAIGFPSAVASAQEVLLGGGRLTDELSYSVAPTPIATKEYEEGQIAYSVEFFRKGKRQFF